MDAVTRLRKARPEESLDAFIGAPFPTVNEIVKLICLYQGRLEWLRGRHRLEMLPRYHTGTLPHVVKFTCRRKDTAERVTWIVENLTEGWKMADGGFWFESELDAMHYSLAFGTL